MKSTANRSFVLNAALKKARLDGQALLNASYLNRNGLTFQKLTKLETDLSGSEFPILGITEKGQRHFETLEERSWMISMEPKTLVEGIAIKLNEILQR